MAHESFEDPDIAGLMNAHFINVKVDREERPDVDKIYMDALHALGQQGGWPLTMFLDQQGLPFWGGTYFPPEPRYGRAGFPQILTEIARIWREEPDKVRTNTRALHQFLGRPAATPGDIPNPEQVLTAARTVAGAVDMRQGGLKGAPKFPQSPLFSFLWDASLHSSDQALESAVIVTLRNICQGGIYDHLGGGLARYSVDADWLVPHFEKMLYDNAQFISLLTRAWCRTEEPLFQNRIEETVAFLLADMTTAGGVFASSYDADSEGEEGRFYVWTKADIDHILGDRAATFNRHYDVTSAGNWEGHVILNRLAPAPAPDEATEALLASCRQELLKVRNTRIRPGFDDKVLTDWNGLAIMALAEAGLVFGNTGWISTAERAFHRLLELVREDGRLFHAYRQGQRRGEATADDFANLIAAALELHAATANQDYLETAGKLTRDMIATHWDDSAGSFYFASASTRDLIIRPRHGHDDATPNANATMVRNLIALGSLTGYSDYHSRAESIARSYGNQAIDNPFAYGGILQGCLALADTIQVILTGAQPSPSDNPMMAAVLRLISPSAVIGHVGNAADLAPDHPAYHKAASSEPRLYLCRGQTCAAPSTTPEDVAEAARLLQLVRP
jgi:hypothetical protein